jgi:hypothetical protein
MRTIPQQSSATEREIAQARFTWYSTTKAGEIAGGVDDSTVRGWIASGELCCMNVGSEKHPEYRIKPEDLAAFQARRTINPQAAA